MKKLLTRAAILGVLASMLSGCIVLPPRGHYYGDRGYHDGYGYRGDRGGDRWDHGR
ncbi:hypothetical protein [Pelomonas sp. KK5]|uniref:hypothetical protein n=1 Tax=Pelomonas sp. KK5 TaxID=1855730 RepID=UPI0018EA07DA|nr:hypothetical protein [Pelomonas sp. KK5]